MSLNVGCGRISVHYRFSTAAFLSSYQIFSRKIGFTSKSFIFNVISGKKNLSRTSVVKICGALDLGKTEAAYFENLVYFNQAQNFAERNYYYEKLNAIYPTTSVTGNTQRLRKDQYEFYSQWYHVVIWSLIDLFPNKKDFRELARLVYPAIRPKPMRTICGCFRYICQPMWRFPGVVPFS